MVSSFACARLRVGLMLAVLGLLLSLAGVANAATPVSGAVFTTDVTCTGVNLNIYANKADVYVDGGPAHPGAAGLPDGTYYVQVTDPSGVTVLGKSAGADVTVSGGEFASCYQLADILYTGTSGFTTKGYDNTPNPGGEYKVWISTVSTFDNDVTKTDNFKVLNDGTCEPNCGPPPQSILQVKKFYDANANGINDDAQLITGWKVRIQDGFDIIRFTPVSIIVAPDDYTVTEFAPVESNWIGTTPNPVNLTLDDGDNTTVEFGNVCVGAGGGLTLGFWSNKNGQAAQFSGANTATSLAMLVGLNLRNASGSNFDPVNYAAFRNWLLNATATNMAYMLSAQLAAMELNVKNGNVSGGSLVYAPGAVGVNALGFISVNDLMAEANTELGLHGLTVSSPYRSYQEALKIALDKGNNSLNFVQGTPCPFSFAT
jgi:hypothetical protein